MLANLNKLRDRGNHLNIEATPSRGGLFCCLYGCAGKKNDTKPDDPEQSKLFGLEGAKLLGIPVDRDRSFRFVVTGDSGLS
jgi:hypothetical protein